MDSDPTEVTIVWKILKDNHIQTEFATFDGLRADCDEIMLTGIGLDIWSRIPILRKMIVIGLPLRAKK